MNNPIRFCTRILAAICLLLSALCRAETTNLDREVEFSIPPQALESALLRFSQQANLQLLTSSDEIPRTDSAGVTGRLAIRAALAALLQGTGLTYSIIRDGTVAISAKADGNIAVAPTLPARLADASGPFSLAEDVGKENGQQIAAQVQDAPAEAGHAIPEILVTGSRSLNMDIKRSRDDAQPYIIFNRDSIEKSGAQDLQTFLRDRLTSMSSAGTTAQQSSGSNKSEINLRGLGSSQTLILIDGHRTTPLGLGGDALQPDINGIPLAAIERIEVLPTTASGIFGGGATGGVVNFVLKRDYRGAVATVTYGDSFDGGGGNRRIDVSGGIELEGGKTHLMLTGSHSDADDLLVGDRKFLIRGRQAIVANDPGAILEGFSPPVGATTNICSADLSFGICTAAPLTLRNGTPVGSSIVSVPAGYAGIASDNGAQLVANAGRYNLDPANTASYNGGNRGSILNAPRISSAMATVRRDLNSWAHAFLELSGSKNTGRFFNSLISGNFLLPAGAAGNPFGQDISVTTPAFGTDARATEEIESRRVSGGLTVDLPASWRGELDYTWGRTRYSNDQQFSSLSAGAGDAISAGILDVFVDTNRAPVDFSPYLVRRPLVPDAYTTLRDIAVRLGGPISWELPAGAPSLAALLEHRQEDLGAFLQITPLPGLPDLTGTSYASSQSIDSMYAEAVLPLISALNKIPGVQMLELGAAVRYDRYALKGSNFSQSLPGFFDADPAASATDKFASADPTVSLRYQPVPDATFRGSYGTGFSPPALNQLVPGQDSVGFGSGRTDPRRNNEPIGSYTELQGGNPNLRPERSTSRSFGVILTPRVTPGLRMSADWTQIKKHDNVMRIFLDQNVLLNEALYPGLITRGPPDGGFEVGPITTVSLRPINVARQEVEAYDLALEYLWGLSSGALRFSAAATRNLHNSTQVVSTVDAVDIVGVGGGNQKWLGNAGLDWDLRQWSLAWTARFFSSYWLSIDHRSVASQGAATVPSQIYHDFAARYRFAAPAGRSVWSGTEVLLTLRNAFNKKPPLDTSVVGQYYSTLGDPRLANYSIALKKAF